MKIISIQRQIKIVVLLLLLSLSQISFALPKDSSRVHTLIFMFDGLRPDYITVEHMPNLFKLKNKWSYGNDNHSVYPTVTRVNSSSYATGSYPDKHGILGNTVYFPQVDKTKGLNTGDASDLFKINNATSGNLLTAVSLGELLQAAGEKLYVFSSGSTGQALLQNHKVSGGAVINPELILPESLKPELMAALGPIPPHAEPNAGWHKWVVDAFLQYGAVNNGPLVSAIWLSDPDGTAHNKGIGSALAMESIKIVDHEFGRIIDSLEKRGLTNYFNILVSTDHGFVSNVGTESGNTAEMLIKEGIKKTAVSDDVVISEGAIYVKDHDPVVIKKIVSILQAQDNVGGIFTKSPKTGYMQGWVDGTLSFEAIHWNHPDRAADILVGRNWNDSVNSFGYAGGTLSRGVAGHGGSSPYEFHIPLIAAGPAFKKVFISQMPSANVDIVPTVLYLNHLPVPAKMDGRVLEELFVKNTVKSKIVPKKEVIETSTKFDGGTYHMILEQTVFGKYRYVNLIKADRKR